MSKPITKKNREHLDSLVIGSGHTIMAGYIPTSIEPQTFSENFYKWAQTSKESVSQFGFWGGEIDYNTYYPNLDKSELTPKDEEFIEPMFRLLSEKRYVQRLLYPVYFSYTYSTPCRECRNCVHKALLCSRKNNLTS